MRISDWSSDVCSSDLDDAVEVVAGLGKEELAEHQRRGCAIEEEFIPFDDRARHRGAHDLLQIGQVGLRAEERRVGKECVRVDLGGRRIMTKKNNKQARTNTRPNKQRKKTSKKN